MALRRSALGAEPTASSTRASNGASAAWDFSRVPAVGAEHRLQRKLIVGEADDPLEHEAERVARWMLSTSEPPRSRFEPGRSSQHEEAHGARLRRNATPERATGGMPVPPIVEDVLSQPGRPLDRASRDFFEPRLGLDLGHVRLHDDSRAAESARAVSARAYTVGNHIAMGGPADATSRSGQRLLAHELVHVVQQSGQPASRLHREPAPQSSAGAAVNLARAADKIGEYRRRAAGRLAGSGLSAADLTRIRRNLATCEAGEQRLRETAQQGGEAASASALSAFSAEGMQSVLPRLKRAYPVATPVAVNEAPDGVLAAMPMGGIDSFRAVEREADRVAAELVPTIRTSGAR